LDSRSHNLHQPSQSSYDSAGNSGAWELEETPEICGR
jgi:hypothetical protein